MPRLLTCLVDQHDLRLLLAAIGICLLGGVLTMRLFGRAQSTSGSVRLTWLAMSAILGGATAWTTHFIAMMGYHSGVAISFDPALTFISLGIAIVTCFVGFTIASLAGRSLLVEAGGMIVGLGVGAMHYVGMAAYRAQGEMIWSQGYVVVSLLCAGVFGVLATSRVARPLTRFCRYGGGLCFILTIATTHFISMAGLTIVPMAEVAAPAMLSTQSVVLVSVVAVMLLILVLGGSSYLLDLQATRSSIERYRYMSLHDTLTGLPNRTAILEQIHHLIANPGTRTTRFAVMNFELERFKEINDVHGHAAGDHVLRVIAERINEAQRSDEFIGRISGDEFIGVKAYIHRRHELLDFASRVIQIVDQPVAWEGQSLAVTCRVGISVFHDTSETVDDLLAQADVALYRAKSAGGEQICIYDPSMDKAARERNALAVDMRKGIAAGEFELYYQRQNDTRNGRTTGFEVLLRWNHPQKGRISPTEFVPIAEKTGLICELGHWVLQAACREAASWRVPLPVAVNVAPMQLGDIDFPKRVLAILMETGLPAARLELEITETGIVADQQRALKVVRELKSYGIRIAMDDYGTGYSSLSMLQLFPFDKIKIDRGFVAEVASNRHSAAIVHSTLILAASLDIPVLAEGVEVEAQLDFLRDAGCAQVQGYYYGRPVPRSEIEETVNGNLEELAGLPALEALSRAYAPAAQSRGERRKGADTESAKVA